VTLEPTIPSSLLEPNTPLQITDMYNHPSTYLNGTAPLNVTGSSLACDAAGNNCTDDKNRDAYLWYDELHPSEQASRVVAREFVGVLKGESKWARYWGS
jgi:phospholipase/lecithinase/hemolysin